MSSPATVTRQIFDGYEGQCYSVPEPANGARLTPTMWRQIFPLDAGTYSIVNLRKGQVVLLVIQGAVTLTNAAGTTIGVFAEGDFVEITAVSDSGGFRYRSIGTDVPNGKFTTSAAASGVVPSGAAWSGAREVYWQNTTDGAMAVTTPSADALIAAMAAAGMPRNYTYFLTIANRGDNTITLTGGEDVGITGEATIATLVTRRYLVTVDTVGATVTMRSIDKGTIET